MTADRNTGQEAVPHICPSAWTHIPEAVVTDHAAIVRMQLEGTLVGQKGVCREAALAALSALEQELAEAKAEAERFRQRAAGIWDFLGPEGQDALIESGWHP